MPADASAAFAGAAIFDGARLHRGMALVVEGGRVAGLVPEAAAPPGTVRLPGGVLAPGLIDLQVNGGGGILLGDEPTVAGIARICAAHARLGATGILPTLITGTPEVTAAAVAAGIAAARAGVPGFLGLHLEGPHLDPRRAGAHDPTLIRPMAPADLAALSAAARALPALMVTLAPEAATGAQIAALAAAGVIVSLGHSDADHAAARAAFAAGARAATHLFNAMSPLGHRAPGLAGAALEAAIRGAAHVGLIADGHHVADPVLRIALAAARGSDRLFLVSDAMATAGTDLDGFSLGGRRVTRREGRLTLADGTLAGADATLAEGIARLVALGAAPEAVLAMATRIPAELIGRPDRGRLVAGATADLVHLDGGWRLAGVWRAGEAVAGTD